MTSKRLLGGSLLLIFSVLGLLPVLLLMSPGLLGSGSIRLFDLIRLLATPQKFVLLGSSLEIAFFTTLLALLIGIPLGFVLGRTNFPGRTFWGIIFLIPLVLPPYILAVAWGRILGRDGWLASLGGPTAAEVASNFLHSRGGLICVLFTCYMPVVMACTVTFLRMVNPRLEEAARLTASWPCVLYKITWPIIRPGVFLFALLVFLQSLGELAVPLFLHVDVFPVETFVQFAVQYDFRAAAFAASPLIIITLIIIVLEYRFLLKQAIQLHLGSSRHERPQIHLRGKKQGICLFTVSILGAGLVILPLSQLAWESASLNAWKMAWMWGKDSLLRSMEYAAVSACIMTFFGFLGATVLRKRVEWVGRALDALLLLLFVLPGTVHGVGLILFWNRPWTNFIYGTPLILVIGFVIQYNVLPTRMILGTLSRLPPSMEEAAQMSGAKWLRRHWKIVFPLCLPGISAGWITAFIFCLRDSGLSMIVCPPGQETLTARIFTLMANGAPSLIAALCLLLVFSILLPMGLILLWLGRRGNHDY